MSASSRVIKFGYSEHKVFIDDEGKKRHKAKCNFCGSTIKETSGTTSNFTRHLQRVHTNRYNAYTEEGQFIKQNATKGQQKLTVLMQQPGASSGDGGLGPYKQDSYRQKQITATLVKDLVVGCTMPLSIVDNEHFRHFMKVVDPRYTMLARSTMSSVKLPALFAESKKVVVNLLASHDAIALTTDIWSDRTMRSFLGVTAHVMDTNPKTGQLGLLSVLLTCKRFSGSHTGERIAQVFDAILEEFGIETKIDYIVTDNAANMKKAFRVRFPLEDEDMDTEEDEDKDDEDDSLWEGLEEEEGEKVDQMLQLNSKQRVSCFAHTLQLVVNDGMKETRSISRAIAKASRLSTLLHKSTVFKDRFEAKITKGKGKTIPAAIATRWNSTFHQLESLLSFDEKELADVCDTDAFRNAAISHREWLQLKELHDILHPFAEATNRTQGDKDATIGTVVPTVVDLASHLKKWATEAKSLKALVRTLMESLRTRFKGVFISCLMEDATPGAHEVPFSEKLYLVAAVLDPRYQTDWVDADVHAADGSATTTKTIRQRLQDTLKELVISEAEALTQESEEPQDDATGPSDEEAPPAKISRLEAKYASIRKRTKSGEKDTPRTQYGKFLEDETVLGMDPVEFWNGNVAKTRYPALQTLAKRVLSVPASSAPVERIFSRGGIIMRPHRASLSDRMMETLMFLKCNEHILQ